MSLITIDRAAKALGVSQEDRARSMAIATIAALVLVTFVFAVDAITAKTETVEVASAVEVVEPVRLRRGHKGWSHVVNVVLTDGREVRDSHTCREEGCDRYAHITQGAQVEMRSSWVDSCTFN